MRVSARLVVCLLFSWVAIPAAAQNVVVETATYVPTAEDVWRVGDTDGVSYGVRFSLSAPTLISSVGIANLTGTGELYAAILTTGASGFPTGFPFNPDEVIKYVRFTPQGGDQRIPFAVSLAPGNYILVVGGAQFGATGTGFIATYGQTLINNAEIFFITSDFPLWGPARVYTSGTSDPLRFVIEGGETTQVMLDSIQTRSSQASVDALAASIGGRASQTSVDFISTTLTSGLQNVFAAIGTRADHASITALGAGVSTQFNSLFMSVGSLSTSIAGLSAKVGTLAQSGDLQMLEMNLIGAVSDLATQASVDGLAGQLGQAVNADMSIEQSLAIGLRLARLWLPEAVGGELGRVRQIVDARLGAAEQLGINTLKARKSFTNGEASLAAGDYKGAYDWYGDAYRQLNK